MYAVIFRAEFDKIDESYTSMATQLRHLAIESYGCKEFTSVIEGKKEIVISYWESLDQIREWKQDPIHLTAQKQGKDKWYKSYSVQIVEIIREYSKIT